LKVTPNIDNNTLLVDAITNIYTSANKVEVTVKDKNSIVAKNKSINKQPVEIAMPQNVKL
jgi:hypothetical protein